MRLYFPRLKLYGKTIGEQDGTVLSLVVLASKGLVLGLNFSPVYDLILFVLIVKAR